MAETEKEQYEQNDQQTEQNELIRQIIDPLLGWFEKNARDLPWRHSPDAYHVWVSEIMLQQTRVEAVKPFYARFMEALPEIADLAVCPEDRLLKLWEGLGYYSRVRNMQKAAVQVMEEYGGRMPADYQKLLALPGIGSYTAGAVSSIAYGLAEPAVDGNVLRVLSRLLCSELDITKQQVKRQYETLLRETMPKDQPGKFNQALMELGAMVCVPNGAPECGVCPLRSFCRVEKDGRWKEIPVKPPKKARKTEPRTVLVIRDTERAAIRKRPSKGLLAGLYELPNFSGHLTQEQALERVRELGFSPIRIKTLDSSKHIFSHVEWHMTGYLVLVEEQEAFGNEDSAQALKSGMLFVEPEKTQEEYPIPAAFSAYAKALSIRLGQEKYEFDPV